MKVGLSSYSLVSALMDGRITILEAIDWVAANGGTHLELVPAGYSVVDNPELALAIREKAASAGIELSAYCIPANFIQATEEAFYTEVERVKTHVDVVQQMGIKVMRHDLTGFSRKPEEISIHYFEEHLKEMVLGSQLIADYATKYGITTTIENHGFNVQASDRVQRVLRAVNRDNFKTTLDIGNFLCVDEDPLVGLRKKTFLLRQRFILRTFMCVPTMRIQEKDHGLKRRMEIFLGEQLWGMGNCQFEKSFAS